MIDPGRHPDAPFSMGVEGPSVVDAPSAPAVVKYEGGETFVPSALLIGLAAAGTLPLLAGVFVTGLTAVGLALDLVLAALVLLDLGRSPGAATLEVSRVLGSPALLGSDTPIRIVVRSRSRVPHRVLLRESLPAGFQPDRVTLDAIVGPGGEARCEYTARPGRRGELRFGPLAVRVRSQLGLFWRQSLHPLEGPVRVYPDIRASRRFELALRQGLPAEPGLRRARRIGTGTELESLRDYSPDDDLRLVDWKASARRGRAVARQHQIERSQPIMLLVEAGRLMSRDLGGKTRLDHAIEAAMLLAHVALARGDRVGLLTFGERVRRYLPPAAGPSAMPALMQSVFDLSPTLQEPDHAGAFQALAAFHPKRSLVVVFTEVSASEGSELLLGYLAGLAPRHLVLVVCIRDEALRSRTARPGAGEREVLEKAAAISLQEEREEALEMLEKGGALVVDVAPGELNLAVLSRYLELKARSRL